MAVTRNTRRKQRPRVTDPVDRRLLNRQRADAAPAGFVTRRVLCEKVGLTEQQFRALVSIDVLTSDGTNGSGYALYKDSTVERLITMKGDGSLFRHLSGTPTKGGATSVITTSPTLHYSAEDGVRVFELLSAGKTLAAIILETRIHPMLVKAIRIDYDDITGSIHLSKDMVDQLNDFGRAGRLPGSFPVRSGDDVLKVIEFCAVDRTCSICEQNAALTACEDCLAQEHRAARAARTG